MKFIQNNFSFEDQEKAETEIMSEVWHWSKADPILQKGLEIKIAMKLKNLSQRSQPDYAHFNGI